nr:MULTISPECIES: ABC transporter permease [Helcobacillus]
MILTVIATLFAYIAASSFFFPRRKYLTSSEPIPEASVDAILDRVNMNDKTPVLERTWRWITDVFTKPWIQKLNEDLNGDWVMHQLGLRAGVSLQLLFAGVLIGAILGVTLGVWGAVRQYKASDQIVSYASFVLISTPTFVLGLLLMVLTTWLNNSLGFQLIRFTGAYTPGVEDGLPKLLDRLNHMILPTIVLILFSAAGYSRYMRSVMLDVLGSDFIRTARAKGATRNHALIKHGVRVALIPMSTYFAYAFGTLVAGSAFLEIIFSWAGMGQYGINAVQVSDVNALTGNVCFTAVIILFSSMLSEILYAALDPRVRV